VEPELTTMDAAQTQTAAEAKTADQQGAHPAEKPEAPQKDQGN
jgi:hypothetical protein